MPGAQRAPGTIVLCITEINLEIETCPENSYMVKS